MLGHGSLACDSDSRKLFALGLRRLDVVLRRLVSGSRRFSVMLSSFASGSLRVNHNCA